MLKPHPKDRGSLTTETKLQYDITRTGVLYCTLPGSLRENFRLSLILAQLLLVLCTKSPKNDDILCTREY